MSELNKNRELFPSALARNRLNVLINRGPSRNLLKMPLNILGVVGTYFFFIDAQSTGQ